MEEGAKADENSKNLLQKLVIITYTLDFFVSSYNRNILAYGKMIQAFNACSLKGQNDSCLSLSL